MCSIHAALFFNGTMGIYVIDFGKLNNSNPVGKNKSPNVAMPTTNHYMAMAVRRL